MAELLARYDVEPSADQEAAVATLDAAGHDVAPALARVVDAFMVMEDATRQAYSGVQPERLEEVLDALERGEDPLEGQATDKDKSDPNRLLDYVGVDLTPVLAARSELLGAAAALGSAQSRSSTSAVAPVSAAAASCGEPALAVAPVIAVDRNEDGTGNANCYTNDFRLVIDAGGADTYRNNAGGNAERAVPVDNPITFGPGAGAGALLDLGGTSDTYGSEDSFRAIGANGGGAFGSGFLYDDGGDDTYDAGNQGTNGGGYLGSGFLYDAGGKDAYRAGGEGTNGGSQGGTGLLFDAGGDDTYAAGVRSGTDLKVGNNGGASGGVAALVDVGESVDTYTGTDSPTGLPASNGGAIGGAALLLDTGGSPDAYVNVFGTGADATTTTATDESVVPKGAVGAQLDDCKTDAAEALNAQGAAVCVLVTEVAGSASPMTSSTTTSACLLSWAAFTS